VNNGAPRAVYRGKEGPLRNLLLILGLGASLAAAQGAKDSIEGYWQDSARRILFSAEAPADYAYGGWTALDPAQTYPAAKEIRHTGSGYELVDLLYDDEERISVQRADERHIDFVRTNRLSGCATSHACELVKGDGLLCALETRCPKAGAEQVVWRGEERYERRAVCERDGKRQLQGIPVRCRSL
jgi:hypothetical protein